MEWNVYFDTTMVCWRGHKIAAFQKSIYMAIYIKFIFLKPVTPLLESKIVLDIQISIYI